DRGRGVQPRLFGGAGRRAFHRDGLHHAQLARRPRVLPRPPAHAPLMAAIVYEQLEITPRRRAWRRLTPRGGAMVGLTVVAFFILIALLAPWLAPFDPVATSWSAVRAAPTGAHPF